MDKRTEGSCLWEAEITEVIEQGSRLSCLFISTEELLELTPYLN